MPTLLKVGVMPARPGRIAAVDAGVAVPVTVEVGVKVAVAVAVGATTAFSRPDPWPTNREKLPHRSLTGYWTRKGLSTSTRRTVNDQLVEDGREMVLGGAMAAPSTSILLFVEDCRLTAVSRSPPGTDALAVVVTMSDVTSPPSPRDAWTCVSTLGAHDGLALARGKLAVDA